MQVSAPTYFDFQSLAALRAESDARSPATLRAAARQFEALFAHMLLKSMRAASIGDGLFDSRQSEFYSDMFDQQMSLELTRGEGLGLAELIVRQLEPISEQTARASDGQTLDAPADKPSTDARALGE